MLQAQKEAEEEDKEMKDVLTDTHVMMATMDLFGGENYWRSFSVKMQMNEFHIKSIDCNSSKNPVVLCVQFI